ncbi:MAG TPA: PEP-CTERM sorting domain-containing protein [Chthoniobacteraceae bacterium]|nr:PEP-CTERM sorting domain-containing protein [Chthoniobacteraceae bacterium]
MKTPSPHSCFFRCGLLFAPLLISSIPLKAEVLFSYSGGTDPTGQGWTFYPGNVDNVQAHAVTIEGLPVWQISYEAPVVTPPPGGTTHSIYYRAVQATDRFQEGWSLKATMEVTIGGVNPTFSNTVYYLSSYDADGTPLSGNNRRIYGITFGLNAQGRTIVGLAGNDIAVWTAPAAGFIEVELRYEPGSGISLYANDTLVSSGYTGTSTTTASNNYILWGRSTNWPSRSEAHWANVEFSVIPEPYTASLLLLGLGGYLYTRGRRSFAKSSDRLAP